MSDIEKRARELIVEEYKARGELVHAMNIERGGLSALYAAEIAAIVSALTPPEGYVLVPAEPTRQMQVAALEGEWSRATPSEVWAAMLAARPEVSQ